MAPGDVLNIGQTAGRVHFGWDVAEAGAGSRVLYPPSDIDAGLDIPPEFTSTLDNWVQCSVQADAPTTSGSGFPRSEGREYEEGSDTALGFDPKDGQTHWIRFRARQVEHPLVDNIGIATGQLHSAADDIVMVRTRMEGTTTNTLVLKVYDPDIDNTVDVLTLDADYQFNSEYDLMFMIHGDWVYVFYQDFAQYVYRFSTSLLPSLTTYFFKSGAYIQFNETTSGVDPTDIGTVHIKNLHHFHTGWSTPQNYFNCPEVDPGSPATTTVNQEFTRTASETGSGITERKWAILDGPDGAGTSLGTSASLSWTPTVLGDYVLIYGAKNAEGWSNPTFLNVTVNEGGGGGGGMGIRSRLTGTDSGGLVYAVPLPGDAVSGDRVYVGFVNDHAHTTTAASAGWTELGEEHQGGTTNHSLTVYTRVLNGSGSDNLTITLTDADSHTALDVAWNVICMQGDPGAPIAPAVTIFADGGSTTGAPTNVSYTGLTSGDYDSIIFLALDNSSGGNAPGDIVDPTNWGNPQTAGLAGATIYSHSTDRALTGVTQVSPGAFGWDPVEQWITAHIVAPGATATAPVVGAGLDASTDQHSNFNRVATEDDGGDTITTREWEVISGPAEVGATLSTSATLNWIPRTNGVYVLRYSATNSVGTDSDDVTITVDLVTFPVSINLVLSSLITGAKEAVATPTINLDLVESITGEKQAIAAVTTNLVLVADADGIFTHAITIHLSLSALLNDAAKSVPVDVSTNLDLNAQVTDPEHHTDAVPVTALLDLLGDVTTTSTRNNNNVNTNLDLDASIIGERIIAEALRAILPRADNTTQYEVVVVARVPQVSGPPMLFEIDPIDWTGLTYTEELNRPSQLDVRCQVSNLTNDIIDRLKYMAELPTELLVYRNGVPTFAGPLLGWRVQGDGDQLSLQSMSLLGYLRYMYVTEDLLFDQVDQFTIAASLINHWQDKEFGHFGIDTSDLGTSGVLRYVTYPRDELHNIGRRIQELGEQENGFDVAINPSSRRLILNSPRQGVDRSTGEDAIIFDNRNVRSPNVIASVAPGDVASEAFGVGEDGRYSTQSNTDLRVKFGRAGIAVSFYSVEEQATLDSYTSELLTARNEALVVPGPNARVTPDSDLASYDVGDTIAYKVHNRLFVGPGIFRIRKRRVSVSPTGQETVSLEFA